MSARAPRGLDRAGPYILVAGFILAALMTIGGGLGLAPAAALTGLALAWFVRRPLIALIKRRPPALILAAGFIVWAVASWFWSPYDRPDQAIKLVLGPALFALVPLAASSLDDTARARAAQAFVLLSVACAVYFLAEAVSDARFSHEYKMAVEGYADPEGSHAIAVRALSRGATPFLLFAGPALILMWMKGGLALRGFAAFTAIAAAAAASAFEVEANIVALAAAALAGLGAYLAPRRMLQLILVGAAALILAAPLIVRLGLVLLPENATEIAPVSWAWRIEIYTYTLERIAERPLFGWGLDAARVLSDPATLRGVEIDRLPLHAHNAGLHIWLETGAIGAVLSAGALAAMALALNRSAPQPAVAAGVAWVLAGWLATVTFGYGIWQEWHHGALALGLSGAMLCEVARRPARNLRFSP